MEQIQKYLVPGSAPKKQLTCWMLGGQDWRSLRLDGRPSRDYCEVY